MFAALPTPSLAPAAAPKAPTPPIPPSPREGAYREVGIVRHASIHALRYRLSGTCKVLKEVDVEEVILNGPCSVGGTFTSDRLSSQGTLEVGGDLLVKEELSSQGSLRVGGKLSAGSLDLEGVTRIGKGVTVSTALAFRGTLEVEGNVSTALFAPGGRFHVTGTLTAREVNGTFDGSSQVDQIQAQNVVLRPKTFVRLPVDVPPLRPKGSLIVSRIEADSVELEGVTVHYLKASKIVLGRHCHVTRVEGTVVRSGRTSHVGYESRSPPPPGLSR